MNIGRLLGAGMLAGLILNIGESLLHGFVLADQAASAMTALGRDITGTPTGLGLLVAITFLQGVVGVWLYAASRLSALHIGLVLWFLSGVYSAIYFYAGFPGLIPASIIGWPLIWELIQYPLAIMAGAKMYGKRA